MTISVNDSITAESFYFITFVLIKFLAFLTRKEKKPILILVRDVDKFGQCGSTLLIKKIV